MVACFLLIDGSPLITISVSTYNMLGYMTFTIEPLFSITFTSYSVHSTHWEVIHNTYKIIRLLNGCFEEFGNKAYWGWFHCVRTT